MRASSDEGEVPSSPPWESWSQVMKVELLAMSSPATLGRAGSAPHLGSQIELVLFEPESLLVGVKAGCQAYQVRHL